MFKVFLQKLISQGSSISNNLRTLYLHKAPSVYLKQRVHLPLWTSCIGYIIQILRWPLMKLEHSYLMIIFMLFSFWVSSSSMKIGTEWVPYENTHCFWCIVVNMKLQELLVLCILPTANNISHLNLLLSTLNVSTQMTVTNLSVMLLVYIIKILLKGSFILVSDCFVIVSDQFYNRI